MSKIPYNRYNNINDYNTPLAQYAITGTNSLIDFLYTSEKRMENIRQCIQDGSYDSILLKEKEGDLLYNKRIGCNSPLCPFCVEKRKRDSRRKFREAVSDFKFPRFMTIGFRNVPDLTREYLKRTAVEFNTFKRYIKRRGYNLGAYIAVMEIKHTVAKGWNMHYHVIYDGEYIPWKEAGKELKKATKGDSWYVNIQCMAKGDLIRSKMKALNYVTKYISKMYFETESRNIALEYYEATRKIRFIKTYGIDVIKEESKYTLYQKFLMDSGHDYLEVKQIICEIQVFIEKFDLDKYDPTKTPEENFFMYAEDKHVLENLEVA